MVMKEYRLISISTAMNNHGDSDAYSCNGSEANTMMSIMVMPTAKNHPVFFCIPFATQD